MICVAGGSGFIGTRLCRRLESAGRDFTIIDKVVSRYYGSRTKIADVREHAVLSENIPACDFMINLAAEHHDNVRPVSLYDDVNVGGAENICNAAREKNINYIVFTSTVAVYGFAKPETGESGEINYFNDYGRTKWLAEKVYKAWQQEEPQKRTLVIIRPTVVFGENNRGNVYNLLKQIASGRFIMIGSGKNRKSMAYVENAAAFIEYSLSFKPGIHIYNYIDKPDMDMNTLVGYVKDALGGKAAGKSKGIRLPLAAGLVGGYCFDALSRLTGKNYTVSSIRVRKFCSDSQFDTSVEKSGFKPPVSLETGLLNTIKHEFINKNPEEHLFYSE